MSVPLDAIDDDGSDSRLIGCAGLVVLCMAFTGFIIIGLHIFCAPVELSIRINRADVMACFLVASTLFE